MIATAAHEGPEAARATLLRRETILAGIINAAMSIGFFLAVFGWAPAASRALALDFLAQTFGITMLGCLVPSLITLARVHRGAVVPAGPVPSRTRQAASVLAAAAIAVPVLGGGAALLTIALAPALVAPVPALAVKTLYGAAVGVIMTPPMIRLALGMALLPRRRRPLVATGHR